MLVELKKILDMAEEGGYCIPAFNVYNIETATILSPLLLLYHKMSLKKRIILTNQRLISIISPIY